MVNINKNHLLGELEKLIMQDIKNKDNLNELQGTESKLSLFRKRVFLEETIDNTIAFNQSLNWDDSTENIHLVRTAEELLEVYKLRSDVYTGLNYGNEFPDYIEGFNFDLYDHNSAIVYSTVNKEVTGTCRLIFDSHKRLPIEDKYSLDYLRDKYNSIGEVSRLMIKQNKKGLNVEFKYLTKGIYLILRDNPINASVSVIKQEHFKLYSKFGGFHKEKELDGYGFLKSKFVITSWNPREITPFFKKMFL